MPLCSRKVRTSQRIRVVLFLVPWKCPQDPSKVRVRCLVGIEVLGQGIELEPWVERNLNLSIMTAMTGQRSNPFWFVVSKSFSEPELSRVEATSYSWWYCSLPSVFTAQVKRMIRK